jgi:hypothetical protein
MDLISEKKKLEGKKEKYDDALAKPIQDKVDKINEQLTQLTQDAIQKQAASEVSLQPETEPGKEMEAGGPEAGPQAAPQQGVLSPEESKRKEELTTAIQNIETGATVVTIGEATMDIADAQSELDAIIQKEQATPEAQKQTTTDIFTAAPTKTRQAITFTSPDGIIVSLDGNEQMAAQLYDEAIATPEEQRSQQQNKIVEKMQPLVTAAAPAVEVTTTEVTPVTETTTTTEAAPVQPAEQQFTEQDRARKQELTDALAKADKRRKNITVGETVMSKADVKAELDALNQKELSSQQPAPVAHVETAPVQTLTPEQEADKLEQMMLAKMGTPKVEAAPVTETAPVTEGKAETEKEKTAKRIRGKKMKGTLSTLDFGITQTVYNGALEFMARQVESGTKIGEAITATINWIDTKVGNIKWDKESFSKYMNTAAESMMPKRKAKEILDVYPKGSTVSIVELAKETKDDIVSNILTKMKDVFKSVKISGRRPTEGAAFYNYNTKEIDVNKNSPHWDEVEGDQIASALSHEFTHHLIDAHPEKESIENELQQIKDDLIANKPALADNQKQAYEFMTAKNNSPQEILTYAVSDPDIRQVLEKYKDKLNNISNKIFGQDVISGKFAEQTIKENEKVQPQRGGDRGGRTESRAITPLEGAPSVSGFTGPDPQLVAVAEEYARENGIPYKRQAEYVKVDEGRAERIAQAYEDMKHDPQNPKVKEAYENLIKQTIAQYEALVKAGYKFWFIDTNIPSNQEYAQSPFNAMRDVRNNKEMGVFPTTDGFGSSDIDVKDNPLMAETKFKWPVGGLDGQMKPVLANDLFRAVHDAFGHGLEGSGFRSRGEENAWQAHIRLFTGSAVGAITSETRGQNSWLNFGPYGETNRTANTEDTVFADQKTGLMPEWTWKEGVSPDMKEEVAKEKMPSLSDAVRSLKIKGPGGLQSNILGVPIAIWNAAMDTVATAIDAGKGLADQAKVLRDALAKGYAEIKEKYKAINKERYEAKVLNRMYSDAIEMARNPVDPRDKISDAGIKIYLMKQGLTESQADALLKIKPKAKEKIAGKPKLDEINLPGYNEMMDKVDAMIARQTKRGTSVDKMAKNLDALLRKFDAYINATDAQKKALEQEARNRIGAAQKRAPSTGRILGAFKDITNLGRKEKSTILNNIMKLAKDAANDLANEIKAMKVNGKITISQFTAIQKRLSKVNFSNEVSISSFVDYMANVFNDVEYDNKMQEVRKLQEQAKRKKHTSMNQWVKNFTSINPELIPANKLLDYIKALDDLNTGSPFYGTMNKMYDEVMSYKNPDKAFDIIKTFQDLADKLESIAINKVKSVEEYVNLIRDINAFKKKAYQLLQNGVISQDQYDEVIDNVGKDQAAVEKKYAKELEALKNDLVSGINKQRPSEDPAFSNEENALIRKYLELSDADLKSLSPEDLFVLSDLLENISNGEIDYYRMSDIVSKAYTNSGSKQLSTQLGNANFNMSSEQGKNKLSEYESAFWEGLLGLGRATSGAFQKFIVSPFIKAIGSYENFLRTGYNEFLNMKKKYNMKDYNMHRLGILTTYLQEHMAQFDPNNKNVKDIGKRDWFREILGSTNMRDDYSSGKPSLLKILGRKKPEIDIIKKIWDSLPKDANGNVDPEAVYNSFMKNDGKYFTQNEKNFFDAVMNWKQKNLTSKQKAANELRGNPFKEIPFHMMRVRLERGAQQIAPRVSGANGLVSIEAGTGKERASEKVGAIMTNFEELFTKGLEQTGRDFYLASALKDINNTLGEARRNLTEKDMPLLKTISQTLSEALAFEFDKTSNNWVSNTLLAAKAAESIFDPERTLREVIAAFFSYPIRAKSLKGYKDLFGNVGQMRELLEFTESPLRLRENINKAIDINDGKIEPKGKVEKLTEYLSGLAERTMMVTSWMPNFRDEFKEITGVPFDMDKFKNNKLYREKYGKAIKEAGAVADAQTEKIVGSTTKAGQRREIRIAPKMIANLFGLEGTVSKKTTGGKIVSFFNNYPYREITEFLNGFKESAEVYKKTGTSGSSKQLLKPLGISMNLAIYGFLGTLSYGLTLMLIGGEDDEEEGEKILDNLFTLKGFSEELAGDAVSLAASRYAIGGKAMLQLAATIGVMSTSDKEQKAFITKALKNSVYLEPLPADKAVGFGGRKEIMNSVGLYIPQFVIAADRFIDGMKATGEISELYKKYKERGISGLTEDEESKALALSVLVTSAQMTLNALGSSIPMYGKVKVYVRGLKKDAGVDNLKAPTEKQKAYNMYKNEAEFQENDPTGYLKAIKKGGSLYEYKENQKEKKEEKNADKPLTDSQIEKLKKENPTKWSKNYGPGTKYYEEQRTPEGIQKRAERRKLEAEIKKIEKQNEIDKKKEDAEKRRSYLGY